MAGNSWDVVESGGRQWLSGSRIEMMPAQERSSWSVANTSVGTDWESADFTSIIGSDALMVMCFININAAGSADDSMILQVKAYGDTSGAVAESRTFQLANTTTKSPAIGAPMILDCHGTDPGKIEYRQVSAGHQIDSLFLLVWGRIRP